MAAIRAARFLPVASDEAGPVALVDPRAIGAATSGYPQDKQGARRCTLPRGKENRVPQSAWSDKRERQYEHIKEGLEQRGRPSDLAQEIASRTVNKERARAGEARQASRTSTEDISSGRRGGLRSHRGSGGRTRDQLYQEARRHNIKGRSKMSKAQLESALDGR